MEHEGNRYLRVTQSAPPPFYHEMFEVLAELTHQDMFSRPTLATIDVESEEVAMPAGIIFLQEAWFRGVEAFHEYSLDPDNQTKDSIINSKVDEVCNTEELEFYIWSVWVDLCGFEHGKDVPKDKWLRNIAKTLTLRAYDVAQTQLEEGC